MKKYLITLLYIFTIITSGFAFAQTPPTELVTGDYTVLAPLPGTTNENCTGEDPTQNCTADINSYLKGFLGLAIGIGSMLAMIYIGIYGFQYAMSDSASVKMANKEKLTEIIQGFLLIISTYAILYTINPDLVKINLDITSPKSVVFVQTVPVNTIGNGAIPGATVTNDTTKGKYIRNGVYYNDCGDGTVNSCPTMADLGLSFTSGTGNVNGGSVLASFGNQLKTINIDTKLSITETWPPTLNHQDPCHKIGTCVDAKLQSNTPENMNKLIDNAFKNGACAVYEVTSQSQKDALVKSGVYAKNILVETKITGPHFSIYNSTSKCN
ncbi:MAG: hypothetical protein ACYCZW_01975 [Minisyncoccota bacterium]